MSVRTSDAKDVHTDTAILWEKSIRRAERLLVHLWWDSEFHRELGAKGNAQRFSSKQLSTNSRCLLVISLPACSSILMEETARTPGPVQVQDASFVNYLNQMFPRFVQVPKRSYIITITCLYKVISRKPHRESFNSSFLERTHALPQIAHIKMSAEADPVSTPDLFLAGITDRRRWD